jgi:hypothetical protein
MLHSKPCASVQAQALEKAGARQALLESSPSATVVNIETRFEPPA